MIDTLILILQDFITQSTDTNPFSLNEKSAEKCGPPSEMCERDPLFGWQNFRTSDFFILRIS